MRGAGCLAIWFRVDGSDVSDLDAWYPRQHLPERLSVPGFLRGRRYAGVDASLPYATVYETEDASVLSSPAYLERLNHPTEWTRRVLPTFRVMVRSPYRALTASRVDTVERHLVIVQVKPDSGRGPYVREWLDKDATTALGGLGAVSGWGVYIADGGGVSVVTEERKLVGGEVRPGPPFLVLLEVADPTAERALRDYWAAWARKIAAEAVVESYTLMYGLGWL